MNGLNDKVVVVLPYIKDKERVDRLGKLIKKRAGIENIEVYSIQDTLGLGWIGIHNRLSKQLEYDWYVYGCDDYFPSRDFIKMAIEHAYKVEKRLIGFNDGKWFGKNATSGMVHKSLLPQLYGNNDLFYKRYKHHGADPDLTEKCILMNEYSYCPEAVFIEVDYEKDFNKTTRQDDMDLFLKRREKKFPTYEEEENNEQNK